MTYSWSSDGQLTPHGKLSGATILTAPVGNPDGGQTFTIWQPGVVDALATQDGSEVEVSQTTFLAWSPNGRYLIDPISVTAIVHPAGEPNPTAAGLPDAPNLAIRDAAEQQVFASLLTAPNGITGGEDGLAWSPDGRILAAIPGAAEGPVTGTAAPVTLYDSATGHTAGTVQVPSSSIASTNGLALGGVNPASSSLHWSADGSYLMLYSDPWQTITIWGPGTLPQTA